jgi:type II secretory pathway pseudopilin PulG
VVVPRLLMEKLLLILLGLFAVGALILLSVYGYYLSAFIVAATLAVFFALRRHKAVLGADIWRETRHFPKAVAWTVAGFVILLIVSVAVSPNGKPRWPSSVSRSSAAMQQARAIYLLLSAYADAHQGAYPTGNSSTAIFQELIDADHMKPTGKNLEEVTNDVIGGSSVMDPAIFFLDLPDKTPATSTQLKPENVGFDVTIPMGKGHPQQLPVVFVTGYRISYMPGGTAIPLPGSGGRDWISVCYNSGTAYAIASGLRYSDRPSIRSDGVILNFVPAAFKPGGRNYVQLTPDGLLDSAQR